MSSFPTLSIRTKIFLGCMTLAAVTVVVGMLSYKVQEKLSRNAIEIYDSSFQSMNQLRLAQAIILGVSRDLALGETETEIFSHQLASAVDALQVARRRAITSVGKSRVDELLDRARSIRGRFAAGAAETTREPMAALEHGLDRTITEFASTGFRLRRDAETLVQRGQQQILFSIAVALLVALGITLILRRAVVPPIQRAVSFATSIAAGNLTNQIDGCSRTEVGRLMQALSTMQASIAEKIASIEELRRSQASGYMAELALQHSRFETAVNHMTMGLCMFDADEQLVVRNRRFLEMFDNSRELSACVTGSEEPLTPDAHAPGGTRSRLCHLEDGRVIAVFEEGMAGGGRVLLYDDVTERQKSEELLTHMVRHDALTGLPNRFSFRETLQALGDDEQAGKLFILCLDLDRFKSVNDTLGHLVGDELLRAAADRLTQTVGPGETVTRLGGDEFAVIGSSTLGARDPSVLAELIIDAFGAPFQLRDHSVAVGVSIGIAIAEAGVDMCDLLLKRGDLALYEAKADGRGISRRFEPHMERRIASRRQMEEELRVAVEARQFELHYQPILDAQSGAINSFEALLRWNHPSGRLVSPADFIPIAEEAGLIVAIGRWALEEACRKAVEWPDHIKVAVNLSPLQFRSSALLDDVQSALRLSRLPPGRLEVEITESLMLQNTDLTFELLRGLHDLGIKIAMDDFGTGYSSLSYLRLFPFDKIKIDRCFVRDLVESSDGLSIVKAVIQLGQSLRMRVVAEGVETAEQISLLRDAGCQELQGYALGRPQAPRMVAGFIADRRMAFTKEPPVVERKRAFG